MNRRLLILAIFAINIVLAVTLLQLPLDAAPNGQAIRNGEGDEGDQEPLGQPVAVHIRQLLPVTLTFTSAAPVTTTAALTQAMPVTMQLDLQLLITQTLTSTVQSTVTLTLSNGVTVTTPISLIVGLLPSTTLVVTPLATITPVVVVEATPTPTLTPSPTRTATPTTPPTPTATVTPTLAITATAATTPALPAITSTVNITANLRSGPGETFPALGQAASGQPVVVVGISADNGWYLLANGAWIFTTLVDNPPANPPLADADLAAAVQATATALASLATPTAPPTVPATLTPASVLTATTTPTPAPILLPTPTPTAAPAPPSVTVNANLRSGPGLEFPIIGGTISGQTLNIVARTASGDWFLLDNGGWVAGFLVANPPDLATVPVFGGEEEITPSEPLTTTPPVTTTAGLTTTAPLTPTTAATTVTPVTLSVLDNLYLVDAAEVVARYDRALADLDSLIAQAAQNTTLLQDANWLQSMTNAIALLRATNSRVRSLQSTSVTQAIQNDLVAAADAYDTAALLLATGIDEGSPATFDEALAAITRATTRLNSASDAIADLTP